MEQFLSTIFPCCFPNRHSRSRDAGRSHLNERTPLLGEGSGSIASTSGTPDGTATPGSETKTLKRKQNSILPSPAYDAHVLKGILDDFKGKLIAIDSTTAAGEKSAALLAGGAEAIHGDAESTAEGGVESSTSSLKAGVKHVTPVHTLRLSVSNSTRRPSQPTSAQPKLVDIWSETSESATSNASGAGSGAILSYSAAVQKGKKGSAKSKNRFGGAPKPLASSSGAGRDQGVDSVEERTFESLSEVVKAKPLVLDWDMDDGEESGSAER